MDEKKLPAGVLTRKEFFRKYVAMHTDVRGLRGDHDSLEAYRSISDEGFRPAKGPNAMPIYDGMSRSGAYGTKAGSHVYIIPKGMVIDSHNGLKVKQGFRPGEDEFFKIEQDGQDIYDAYVRNKMNLLGIRENKNRAMNIIDKILKEANYIYGKEYPEGAVRTEREIIEFVLNSHDEVLQGQLLDISDIEVEDYEGMSLENIIRKEHTLIEMNLEQEWRYKNFDRILKSYEKSLNEISTPSIDTVDLPSYGYDTPKEKEQKKKKAERERGYREEGRYDGLY